MKRERKIRVLFIIDYLGAQYGGTESQLLCLLCRLDRSRFDPFLCCLWPTPWNRGNAPPCDHAVLFDRPIRWAFAPFSVMRMQSFIRARGFDIVQTFFPTSNVLGVLAARLCSVKVILSSRRDLGYWKRWQDNLLLRAVRHIPTCYVANSQAVKRQVVLTEGIHPDRVRVVYNGVACDDFRADFGEKAAAIKGMYEVPDGAGTVGVVANYYRAVKGLDYFIKAAAIVAAEMPNVRFFVVGQGDEVQDKRVQTLLHQRGLQKHFVFTGKQQDIGPFLALLNVGVLPSLSEGFSNSLLEYMAAGLPAVATDVGGNRELLTDGETGFLVPPASPRALAQKIVLLLKDARLRESLGENARRTVRAQFSIEKMVASTEKLYESLLMCKAPAGKWMRRRSFLPSAAEATNAGNLCQLAPSSAQKASTDRNQS